MAPKDEASEKIRLDTLLVERGLAFSREKAQALIMAGSVLVEDRPVDKAGARISRSAAIRLRGEPLRFVGRGGDKLEGAIEHFQVILEDRVAIDVGASTGGFTDCMLQRGARLVYAIDVGTNQLDHRLRTDPRVKSYEKTNARELDPSIFDPRPTFGTIDVSFIGVRKILDSVDRVMAGVGSELMILVKPQFELGPEFVEKGGVVRDPAVQARAVRSVEEHAAELGWLSAGSSPSVLRGEKKGNQEHFLLIRRS